LWDEEPGWNGDQLKVNTPIVRIGINRRAALKRGLRGLVLPIVGATMLMGSVAPAFSGVGIDIEIAPPAPRVVVVPPPRPGFVWAPGYYRWDGHRHVWVDGHFIRERRGSHWVPEHWDEHHGRYHFEPGHWERG
jgi:WXXGXW repeat (2 copies)